MRMEMEGKEPLVVIFGIPIITTGIVLGSMYMARESTHIVPPPAIHVEAPKVLPKVTAVLPEGGIQVINQMPPLQVREVVREVPVREAPARDEPSRAEPAATEIRAAQHEKPEAKVIPVPIPVAVPEKRNAFPRLQAPKAEVNQDDHSDDADKSGQLLPPPLDAP